MNINKLHIKQRDFFNTHATQKISFRRTALKKLLRVIEQKENSLYEALFLDLKKSEFESYLTEYFVVMSELELLRLQALIQKLII